jgi:hypothetical protein
MLYFLAGTIIDLADDRALSQTKPTIAQDGKVEGVA